MRQEHILSKTAHKGVTLIELLIVVLILAALSAIAIPRISKCANTAKARLCHTNIDIINQAIEEYRHNTNAYPANMQEVTHNTAYFPEGPPICPITKSEYSNTLVNSRVDTSGHAH
jgi:prepilin-type N-terminal cleavage/methylation domain-containing protein